MILAKIFFIDHNPLNKYFQISLLSLLLSISYPILAQDTIAVDTPLVKKPLKQRDLIDIVQLILHKPERVEEHKEGKTFVSILPAAGYTLQTGFAVLVSGSIAFYASENEKQKISNIQTSVTYTQYNQFILPIFANFWTKDNKYFIVSDTRYMHYPSLFYGLNGQTSLKDRYTVDYSLAKIHQSFFKSIGYNMYAGLGYYFDYVWNIKELNIAPTETTLFQQYGLTPTERASGPAFRYLYDSRLNLVNPKKGAFTNVVFRPNFKFLGGQSNWQSLLLEFRKYIPIERFHHVLGLWSYNWLTLGGKPPYILLPSTGWDDNFNTGRGYIQGRFRGRNMFYAESEYRFGITRNGLIGAVVFTNAQLFSKETSFTLTSIHPAAGAGIRVKLNKFSGTNLCIDYGVGTHGSKGFFVNINEVF